MENIRDIRHRTGLTQEGFGNYFGISRRTIQNWEKNDSCPEWAKKLIIFKLEHDDMENKVTE